MVYFHHKTPSCRRLSLHKFAVLDIAAFAVMPASLFVLVCKQQHVSQQRPFRAHDRISAGSDPNASHFQFLQQPSPQTSLLPMAVPTQMPPHLDQQDSSSTSVFYNRCNMPATPPFKEVPKHCKNLLNALLVSCKATPLRACHWESDSFNPQQWLIGTGGGLWRWGLRSGLLHGTGARSSRGWPPTCQTNMAHQLACPPKSNSREACRAPSIGGSYCMRHTIVVHIPRSVFSLFRSLWYSIIESEVLQGRQTHPPDR